MPARTDDLTKLVKPCHGQPFINNLYYMDVSLTTDRILAYLDLPQLATKQPRVSAIAVTSLDGRATINGVSGGLGNALDARIFNTHRALADVVFVGAGTIKAEEYGPVEVPDQLVAVRRELGKADSVPIATISRSLSLDTHGPMFDAPRIDEATNDSTGSVLIFSASPADAAQTKGAARQTHTKNDGAIEQAAWKERREALVAAELKSLNYPSYRHALQLIG